MVFGRSIVGCPLLDSWKALETVLSVLAGDRNVSTARTTIGSRGQPIVVMPAPIVRPRIIEETAEDSDYSVEEISDAIQTIHDAIRSNLHDHYERCWLSGGMDYHLYELDDQVWFAMGDHEIRDDLRKADMDLEFGLQVTASEAFRDEFQVNGKTISMYRNIVERRSDPMLYPVATTKSEGWQEGEFHAYQTLKALVNRPQMSPAEALDYWVVEHLGTGQSEWAGARRVGEEAVRKNVRQAREKISEKGLGSGYDVNDIRVVDAEDWPDDSVFDEDRNRYYLPIGGHLAREGGEE